MSELTSVPSNIASGTTVIVRLAFSEYPASSWDLVFNLAVPSGYTQIVAEDGDDFVLLLTSTITATWPAGEYRWDVRAEGTDPVHGAVKFQAASGFLTVTPNLAVGSPTSYATWEERALAACRAKLEGRVTADQEEMQVYGRAVKRIPIVDLMKLISHLEVRIAQKRSGRFSRPVLFKFSGTGFDR